MLAQAVLAARAPAEGGTRLIEWWSLLSPHTALETGLSAGTCSRRPCLPCLWILFASGQTLSHFQPAMRTVFFCNPILKIS